MWVLWVVGEADVRVGVDSDFQVGERRGRVWSVGGYWVSGVWNGCSGCGWLVVCVEEFKP